jgi:hypothetical protein
MSRKRTNLDTAEAEFLYANVLVELNKKEAFQKLSIPERNNLVDKVAINVIKKSCKDAEHIQAISEEIVAYKLSGKEEAEFYSKSNYVTGLEKPANFNELLKTRYANFIKEEVKLINTGFK